MHAGVNAARLLEVVGTGIIPLGSEALESLLLVLDREYERDNQKPFRDSLVKLKAVGRMMNIIATGALLL